MRSPLPLISVIIPAYNCENYIGLSIESILKQTYPEFEMLIADDASTENTRNIIDSVNDKRMKCFHNKTNLGYLKTCNKLLALAKGDFIAFQDADDISDVRRFELQMKVFRDADVGVVGSNMVKIYADGTEMERSNWTSDIKKNISLRCFDFIPNSFLFRKEVYMQIGGYNEYFNRIGFEDFYWTALAVEKFMAVNVAEHLYYYRVNPDSVSNKFKELSVNFSYQSLLLLLEQRQNTGIDLLEQNKVNKLKSLVYRKMAAAAMSKGEHQQALKEMMKSIKYNPFLFYNYRTLFYFWRKKEGCKGL